MCCLLQYINVLVNLLDNFTIVMRGLIDEVVFDTINKSTSFV